MFRPGTCRKYIADLVDLMKMLCKPYFFVEFTNIWFVGSHVSGFKILLTYV